MINKNVLRIIFCFFVFATVSFFSSQTPALDKLDHITEENRNSGNIKYALNVNIEALKLYRKTNNKEGAVSALIHIGDLLNSLSDYEGSIKYLDQAKKRLLEIKNPELESKLYKEYGRSYSLLGMHKQSNVKLDESIEFAHKVGVQKKRKELLYDSYTWKWYNFDMLNETDSVQSMQRKCLQLSRTSLVYVKMAMTYIHQKKHLDSADYYLKKALAPSDNQTINDKAMAIVNYGKLYTLKNDHKKALDYYFEYLSIARKMKNANYIRDAYKEISNSYKVLDDTENANLNLNKYLILNDSINKTERVLLNNVTEKLLIEKQENGIKEKNKLYLTLFCITLVFIAVFFFFYRKYRTTHQKSEVLITEKTRETDQLKKKINASFQEIAELAKSRDPFFLTRFKEVYPEFCEKLNTMHPILTDHDMKFCAYIRLNLTHKEIAQYENITVKSVDTKKYRIKKKLELDANVDFNRWIAEL